MGILIGMDEAGYGPNYGPLVVAATAWEVPDGDSEFRVQGLEAGGGRTPEGGLNGDTSAGELGIAVKSAIRKSRTQIGPVDLYQTLRSIVCKSASEQRIAIADSKALYKPGLGLRQLERGIHAVLAALGSSVGRWSALRTACHADPDSHCARQCWHDDYDCDVPVDAAAEELSRLASRFSRACAVAGVRPLAIRARYVFAAEFNDLVSHYGSKGAALSHVTVGLLREVMDAVCLMQNPPGQLGSNVDSPASSSQPDVFALCDKHGGRNYYTALLQHHFAEHWVNPTYEGHVESRYEWSAGDSRVRVCFRMEGERFFPTALASMTAKYLRELAMRPFNEFWCVQVPGLRPTAGYPVDSHRFRKAIAAKQRELGIDDHVLWRNR
jgi:hypothetical protein